MPWREASAILLILLAGILVYSNTFHAPFVLDSNWSIVRNADIRSLETIPAGPRYVSYVTFALNYRFGGLDVTGYHVVNLAIHLVSAFLVYALLRLIFRTPYFGGQGSGCGRQKDQFESQTSNFDPNLASLASWRFEPRTFIPLFAALLFVVHPVQTQAVTYVVQRITSLCTLFYLLSIVLYVQARLRRGDACVALSRRGAGVDGVGDACVAPTGGGAGAVGVGDACVARTGGRGWVAWLWLAGSVISAVLAMKTKEIAFTLPLAVVLYEVFFFRGPWRRRLLYLLPILATLPIVPLAVMAWGDSSGDVLADLTEKSRAHTDIPRLAYLFTQFRVIVTYLRLLVLPVNQNLDYDYPVYTSFFTPPVFFSFLFLLALFLLALYLFWSSRIPRHASRPLTHSSRITRHASRPLTHPSLLTRHASRPLTHSSLLTRHASRPLTHSSLLTRHASRLLSFGLLWFFLTLSVESSVIPIEDVIFEHRLYLPSFGAATAFASASFLVGGRLTRRGGRGWFSAAAAGLIVLLGIATFQRNHVWGDEIRLWEDTVSKSPAKARPYNDLGVALMGAGRLEEAIDVLRKAIELDRFHPYAYNNLGRAYIFAGQSPAALEPLRMAIRIHPRFEDAYVNLASALNQQRKFEDTVKLLERHLDWLGGRTEIHYHLGVAYAFLGNRKGAAEKLEIVSQAGRTELVEDLLRLLR